MKSDAPARLVATRRDNAVQVIRLARPGARNALNAQMLDELHEALQAAASDPAVRSVLLEAEGPVFCAGGDLKEIFADPTPDGIKHFLDDRIRPVLRSMVMMRKPIVAALNGPVAGAGIGVALAADVLLAAESASFVPAFGKVGAMPDSAVLYLMVQNIGLLRAKDIVFNNRSLTANEAAAAGLYTRVVSDADLAAEAAREAAALADGPTVALGLAKQALREASRSSFDGYLDLESLSMALINTSADQREGIRAFMDRRPPVFSGR